MREFIKKVIGVFFEIKEEPVKTRKKIPFEDNPNVDYKGYFCWENEMTLKELLDQETVIKEIWIYEG